MIHSRSSLAGLWPFGEKHRAARAPMAERATPRHGHLLVIGKSPVHNGAMRGFTPLFLFASAALFAQGSDKKDAVAAVQKTFNGMAAHDAEMIRSTMLPNAQLYAARDDGTPTTRSAEDFVSQIASTKGGLLERFTSAPRVSIRGRMAQVWGEYEFLRDGKFSHCGVDSVSLFKTAEGWKIATIAYTVETAGCGGR